MCACSKNHPTRKRAENKKTCENKKEIPVMVLLTAILAACAFVSCITSCYNIHVLKEIEHERSRPMVVLELLRDSPFYGFRLRNTGLTAARDLVIRTEPEIEWWFDSPNKQPIRFLKEKIDYLPPDASLSVLLGDYGSVNNTNPSLLYRATIQYTDMMGRHYEEIATLDYSLYEGTLHWNKKTINDIGNELEQMRVEIGKIGSNFNKMSDFIQALPSIVETKEHHSAFDSAGSQIREFNDDKSTHEVPCSKTEANLIDLEPFHGLPEEKGHKREQRDGSDHEKQGREGATP